MKIAAVIPARSGSERVKDKNITPIMGTPLLSITAMKAQRSKVFDGIYPITDSPKYMDQFVAAGLQEFTLRPDATAQSNSPDISWLRWWMELVGHKSYDVVVILRPTSPLRRIETIREGVQLLQDNWDRADSIRCVSPVDSHPGKMWVQHDGVINPLFPFSISGVPWHSNQTKTLPSVLVQNAMLEVIKTSSITRSNSISGGVVIPLVRSGYETLDINTTIDLEILEFLLKRHPELKDW